MFSTKQEACTALENNCNGQLNLKIKNSNDLVVGTQLYNFDNSSLLESGFLIKSSLIYTITNGIITAIENCLPSTCTLNLSIGNISACANNLYNISGTVSITNIPLSGTLIINVGSIQQTIPAPFTSPVNFNLIGLNANGLNNTLTATLSTCVDSEQFTAPVPCVIVQELAVILPEQVLRYNMNGTVSQINSDLDLSNNILTDLQWNTQFLFDSNYTKTAYIGIRNHDNLTSLQNVNVSDIQGFDLAPIILYTKNSEKWKNAQGCQTYVHIPTNLNRRVWQSNLGKVTTYVMPQSYVFNSDVRPNFVNYFPNFNSPSGKIVAISVFPDTEVSTWNCLNKGVTLVGAYDINNPSIFPPINKVAGFDGDVWLYNSGVPHSATNQQIYDWAVNVQESTLLQNFQSNFYNDHKAKGLIMMDGEAIGGRAFDPAIQKMANVINWYRNQPDSNALVCFWGYSFWTNVANLVNTNRDWEFTGNLDSLLSTYPVGTTGLSISYGKTWASCFDVLFCTPNYINTPDQQFHIYTQITTGLFNKKYFPDKKVIWSTWEMFEFSGNSDWQISSVDKLKTNGTPIRRFEFYKAFPSYMQSVGAWSVFAMDGVYQWDSTHLISTNPDYYGYAENKVFNVDGTPITINSYGTNAAVNPARNCKNTDWLMAGVWAVSQSNDIIEANTPLHFTDYSTDGGVTWRTEANKQAYSWNCHNDSKPVVMHKLSSDGNTALLLAYNGFNNPVLKQTIKVIINTKIFDIDLFGQYTNVSRIDLT